ncbi:hypothetical protein ACXZ1M_14355 [Duganella sp. PWIR1]
MATKIVWVINGAKWQIGQLAPADKRVKFVNSEFSVVPSSCPMKTDFYDAYAELLQLEGVNGSRPPQNPQRMRSTEANDADAKTFAENVSILQNLRKLSRDECPQSRDNRFNASVRRLKSRCGTGEAAEHLAWACDHNDLNLTKVLLDVLGERDI